MVVWMHATLLMCIKTENAGRSLYFLVDYYVELIYDCDEVRVLAVYPFKDLAHLDDWLEDVNITQLLIY